MPGTAEPNELVPSDPKDNSFETMDWLETIVMAQWVPSAVSCPTESRHCSKRTDRCFVWPGADDICLRCTAARDHITLQQNPNDIDLRSYLPPKVEAFGLFRYYCDNLDFHFHTVVPHQVEKQVETIYERQSRHQPINLNHTALLSKILASALHYRLQPESLIPASAYSQADVFLSGAALIQSNDMAYPTLEGLQATMTIIQNLSSTGLPPAVGALFMPRLCISQAMKINLHLVDSPRMKHGRSSGIVQEAGIELKRRIWWSLVSNDW